MNCNLEDLDKDQPEDYWKTIGPRADKKKKNTRINTKIHSPTCGKQEDQLLQD